MAPRANWKGYLKLGELNCAVALYTAASTSDRVSFHMVNRQTGNRLNREFVDSETGKPVERDEQIKGYEVSGGDYVTLEPEEVAAAVSESDRILEIGDFVTCNDIDDVFFVKPYYLAPADKQSNEIYALIRVGSKVNKVAAIAQTILFRRVRTLLIRPHGERLPIDKSPFAGNLESEAARGVRFVEPKLVAEVEFRAWTADGNLRHAAFRGLREDKLAKDVTRESGPGQAADKPQTRKVKLTHPDRIYWPDAGVTKEGLADYYSEVWPKIAPFITGRPLALLRSPEGIEGLSFFQKHAWRGMNKEIGLFQDPTDPPDEKIIVIDDLDGLLGLVQSAVLEIHPWGSTAKDLEKPDMIILDLDPGDGVTWSSIIEAAREVKQRLEEAGLAAFVKTSGGKGLHVVAPLKPSAGWDEAKIFTKAIADAMATDEPDKYVSTITKSKRTGKILIDYLRNGRNNTAVAAYSTRARKGAPVSMPLDWEELNEGIGPNYFTVLNAPQRLASLKKDPWENFRGSAKPLPKVSMKKK